MPSPGSICQKGVIDPALPQSRVFHKGGDTIAGLKDVGEHLIAHLAGVQRV